MTPSLGWLPRILGRNGAHQLGLVRLHGLVLTAQPCGFVPSLSGIHPVIIRRESRQEVRCNSVNISGGGMALGTQVPLPPGESVRVQFTLPDHEAPVVAESTICWSKTGHLGVRFQSISDEHKSELQVWLSQKLEQILPEFVADQFRKAERGCK